MRYQELIGLQAPIWVENAESITNLHSKLMAINKSLSRSEEEMSDQQIFFLTVSAKDKEIRLEEVKG